MTAADISFDCPHCAGPLITEAAHAGAHTECPHCYQEIEVPAGVPVNKNKFIEPLGLRRALLAVRDQEWELHRRKLRLAIRRNEELEAILAGGIPSEASNDAAAVAESEALRTELAAAQEELAVTLQALAESREQHGITLSTLRFERDAFRQEFESLNTALQKAEGEVIELRESLSVLRDRLEEEAAKVFIMEAAISSDMSDSMVGSSELENLRKQVEELQERNDALQQSHDGATEELARFHQDRQDVSEQRITMSMGALTSTRGESGLSSRRSS